MPNIGIRSGKRERSPFQGAVREDHLRSPALMASAFKFMRIAAPNRPEARPKLPPYRRPRCSGRITQGGAHGNQAPRITAVRQRIGGLLYRRDSPGPHCFSRPASMRKCRQCRIRTVPGPPGIRIRWGRCRCSFRPPARSQWAPAAWQASWRAGRAPAYAQTQTMQWLRWADFVPASDVLLKGDIV